MPVSRAHPDTPAAAARLRVDLDDRLDLELFKALADGNRLRVLSCLVKCGRPCSTSEVAESCEVEFSVVNKHLKILARAGVLEAEKRGRTVWYAARCGDLSGRLSALVDAIGEWCPNRPQRAAKPHGAPCCGERGRARRR
jgi:ArsR family transcriptional regulator